MINFIGAFLCFLTWLIIPELSSVVTLWLGIMIGANVVILIMDVAHKLYKGK